jgi:hypothetical protein
VCTQRGLKCLCLTDFLLTRTQAAGRKQALQRRALAAKLNGHAWLVASTSDHCGPDLSENTREEKHGLPVMAHAWC